jgi:TonB family protein
MDVEGGAGGDSFGLVGRKGGRSIIARSGGGSKPTVNVPLMVRFAGYIKIVTAEIKMRVIKRLDEEGGIPKGKLQCTVRVSVDKNGQIIDYRITKSSGNTRMDQAIIRVLRSCQFSEPPPLEMPTKLDIMITSQG